MSARIVDPTVEPHLTIDDRTWNIPSVFQTIAVQYDENSETVHIDIPRYFDGIDRAGYDVYLRTVSEEGGANEFSFKPEEIQITDNHIVVTWTLNPPQTSYSGPLKLHIIIRKGDDYQWSTYMGRVNIKELN